MSLVLPFDNWPESDRAMWRRLVQDGGSLDDRGAFAHLRESPLKTLRTDYDRWLAWLATADPTALADDPPSRVTMARLRAWLEELAHLRPMSRLCFVGDTLRMVQAAEPNRDWTAQERLKAQLKRLAGNGDKSRKAGRILSSAILFEAGASHAKTDAEAATTLLGTMKRRRNGTMVALLALMPMRRRAFTNLRLGESILVQAGQVIIWLPEELTKSGRPWEAAVPEAISSLLMDYITEVRPWFMARGRSSHSVLWVDDRGLPFDDNCLGAKIAGLTTQLTGVRVPPHFFRDAAATTLARTSPQAARLIRPVLAHSGFETAERHYIHAGSIEAGRNYAAVLKRLKGRK